jgi:hypothetical protein
MIFMGLITMAVLAVGGEPPPRACPDPALARPLVFPATTFTVTKEVRVGDPWLSAAVECRNMKATGRIPWMPGTHWSSGCVSMAVGATQQCMIDRQCPRRSLEEPISECQEGCFLMFDIIRDHYGVRR